MAVAEVIGHATCNVEFGLVVPMPTLPFCNIVNNVDPVNVVPALPAVGEVSNLRVPVVSLYPRYPAYCEELLSPKAQVPPLCFALKPTVG